MIMTVQQMHEQFLHWLDKQSNNSAPELTAEEIDIYLNNAYYQFLKSLTEDGLEKEEAINNLIIVTIIRQQQIIDET